ncbi:MAG: GNAT family N-acetyltransferase [Eubacteriales bacterium]|nr:GNAT family N-acetyltransferase [Eubacteriales bacterium]
MTEIIFLTQEDAFEYRNLTLKQYQGVLFTCGKENVIAVGASEEGKPLGLILACRRGKLGPQNDDPAQEHTPGQWQLCSIFIKEDSRAQCIGKKLWEALAGALASRGAWKISFQSVLREETERSLAGFFVAVGFQKPERIAKIFSYSGEKTLESSFVKACRKETRKEEGRFQMISPREISEEVLSELRKNEGNWYPAFVSPFIGWNQMNQECTVFAIDSVSGKMAAWITAMDVNNGDYLLYRTFFAREEFRGTSIGFYIFSEAIRRFYAFCPEKKALASIPMDNEKSMRFNELFFQGAHDHVSFEISAEYIF